MYRSGVDAVCVNYRTPEDLARFVTSWQKYEPDELWVRLLIVNVSPTPEDTEVAESFYRRGEIEVVQYFENIGYGRACNLGAERPHGDGFDVIALFNADVELRAGAIEECYFALTSQDEWGVLGPRQVDDRGRLVHAGIVGTGAKPRHRGWQEVDRGQYVDVLDDVPTVSGSAYFIKRRLWVALKSCTVHQLAVAGGPPGGGGGAFLPTPHYYEETWCSYHARAHGWRCVYFGDVTVTHSWHRASPVGGWAESHMPTSRAMFRRACELHGIEHD